MNDNGLNNVMELIERREMGKSIQKERIGPYEIFVKEFYAKMTVIHLKKKDIVKSKVRGVEIEFDHEKLATILGIHRNNGMREYVKDVWEESKYIKPLEITEKGEEPKKYDFFEDTFLTMCKLTRENGIWWIGSGENRRRDDDEAAQEEEAEGEDEGNRVDFGGRRSLMRQAVEGESGSGRSSMMLEEDARGSRSADEIPARCYTRFGSTKDKGIARVDPSGPTSEKRLYEVSSEFERKRANKFHDELEKAKARMRTFSLTSPSQIQIQPLDFLT
ncbi:hypothetical protein Dimus_016044 [Dionaea muscipula]